MQPTFPRRAFGMSRNTQPELTYDVYRGDGGRGIPNQAGAILGAYNAATRSSTTLQTVDGTTFSVNQQAINIPNDTTFTKVPVKSVQLFSDRYEYHCTPKEMSFAQNNIHLQTLQQNAKYNATTANSYRFFKELQNQPVRFLLQLVRTKGMKENFRKTAKGETFSQFQMCVSLNTHDASFMEWFINQYSALYTETAKQENKSIQHFNSPLFGDEYKYLALQPSGVSLEPNNTVYFTNFYVYKNNQLVNPQLDKDSLMKEFPEPRLVDVVIRPRIRHHLSSGYVSFEFTVESINLPGEIPL